MNRDRSKQWDSVFSKKDIDELKWNYSYIEKLNLEPLWNNVQKYFPGMSPMRFDGLRIAELGGGTGMTSLLFAMHGAEVTVVDYSESALQKAEMIFDHYGCSNHTHFVNADITDSARLMEFEKNGFDITHSWGVVEHFEDQKTREQVIKNHLNILGERGCSFIRVFSLSSG